MLGYRVRAWGTDPVWEEIPDPTPGPDEVLVDVEACGVGLTVLNCVNGDLANDPELLPRVPGHELVGRVTAAGPGAGAELVGRRVVAYFYLVCGTCPSCRAGNDPRCSRLAGWVGVHRDGGYAPQAVLPALNAIPIADGIDPVAATVIPDALATPVHVAGRAGIGPDDRVVVLAAGGGVGIHMVQVAKARGAAVAGLDVVDAKLAQIESLGAVAVRSDDLAGVDAAALFGGGPPTVVVDLLGIPGSMGWSVASLGMGGRMVALTTFRDRTEEIESRELVFREISVLGSRYANRAEVAEAAHLVAAGSIRPIVGEIRGPHDVGEIHDMLRSRMLIGRGALDWRER
jgi:D-arabinose 1-dehydrogenase-like Zn-dependent alcohol dehydrogenase